MTPRHCPFPKAAELTQVRQLGDLKNIRLNPREVGHPLENLAFCHSEDAAGTVVARYQLPQSNGLLRRGSPIPPVVNEEGKELLRYGGLRAGIERVERFPFSGRILPFTGFLNQTENGQGAIEVVFSSRPARGAVAVKKNLPMLFEGDDRSGPLILLRLFWNASTTALVENSAVGHRLKRHSQAKNGACVFVLMSQWSSQLLE